MPEHMPEHIAEDMPGRMPEDMPNRMPEYMPDKMPKDMSDRMPEDLPVTKRIDVMVGIGRSKVIIAICFLFNWCIIYVKQSNISSYWKHQFAALNHSTNPGAGHGAGVLAGGLRWQPKVIGAANPAADPPPNYHVSTEAPVIYGVFCLRC